MMKLFTFLFTLLLLSACDTSQETPEQEHTALQKEYETQRALYDEQQLNNYTFTFSESCFCPDLSPKVIEVYENNITNVYNAQTFEAIDDFSNLHTIDQLFDIVEQTINDEISTIIVEYDAEKHYPSVVRINLDQAAVDGAYSFFIEINPAITCTAVFVSGITIAIVDSDTNASIGCNATIDINSTLDTYTEHLSKTYIQACQEPESFSGLGERAGIYDITINKRGYKRKTLNAVRIERNLCHVIPLNLTVKLEKEDENQKN